MAGGNGGLILVATLGGPTMFAHIGIMRALNRHVERVFKPDRKRASLGKTQAGARLLSASPIRNCRAERIKPPKTFSSFRIPSTVTKSLAEADIALQGNACLAACVMFGRALEALCRDVLFTREEKKAIRDGTSKKRLMLAEGIKQLRDKNYIDSRLFDWSQHLHAFRNLAAHSDGDGGSITREDAEDLQAFVYAIIEYIYDLADRYQEFKERQEKRAKAKARSKAEPSIWGDDT
jgi:Domain of unknown function (DUF4145)